MKRILALLVMLFITSAVATAASPIFTATERTVVNGAFKKLSLAAGFAIDDSHLKVIRSESEYKILFGDEPAGLVAAKPGIQLIYINAWQPLWQSLTDVRLTYPEHVDTLVTSQVITASLFRFSLETITGGAGGKGTTDKVAAHQAELDLLLFYKKKGVKQLDVPIKEAKKEIERLQRSS